MVLSVELSFFPPLGALMGGLWVKRQGEIKGYSAMRILHNPDATAMSFDDGAGDGESQSHASFLCGEK